MHRLFMLLLICLLGLTGASAETILLQEELTGGDSMLLITDTKIRVMCYGDSNTWGTIGKWIDDDRVTERYPSHIRWTGALQATLGGDYDVLEEGLGGRTTIYTKPGEEWKNGERGLTPCLSTCRPIDLVVMMLGTNDLQINKSITAEELHIGISRLADMVLQSRAGRNGKPPKLLIVAPVEVRPSAPEGRVNVYDKFRCDIGHNLSLLLPEVYRKVAEEKGCYYFNAQAVAEPGPADGVHLDAVSHLQLGKALGEYILREVFPRTEEKPQPVLQDGSGSVPYMRFRKVMRSAQGMGIWKGRAFILYDTGMCAVYDLMRQNPEAIDVLPLGSFNDGTPTRDYLNHANSCMFSRTHLGDNPIPLLYVTIGTGTGFDEDGYYYRCAVENITRTVDEAGKEHYKAETVQTITYQPGDMAGLPYVQPCWGCPAFLMDPDTDSLYIFSAKYRTKRECLPEDGVNEYIITRFRLPALAEGPMVRLTPADIQDQFTVSSKVMFTQGGTILDGKLIYTFGCPKIGYPVQVMIFDLKEKKLIAEVGNMDEAFFGEEIECCAPFEGQLLCNTCDGGIYTLRYAPVEE